MHAKTDCVTFLHAFSVCLKTKTQAHWCNQWTCLFALDSFLSACVTKIVIPWSAVRQMEHEKPTYEISFLLEVILKEWNRLDSEVCL